MTNEIVKQDAQEVQTVSGYEAFRERCAKTIELCDDAMMAHDDYVLDPSECAGIVRALPLPEVKFAPIGVDDLVAVHRSLLGAACSAISKKRDAPRTVANLRRHTTGDLSVSSSVEYLRKENEHLREALIDLISIVKIHQDATKNRFAWAEIDCAEEALKGGAA